MSEQSRLNRGIETLLGPNGKKRLEVPEFIKSLPPAQQQAILTSYKTPFRMKKHKNEAWNGYGIEGGRPLTDAEARKANAWSTDINMVTTYLQAHPGAKARVAQAVGPGIMGIVGGLLGAAASYATGNPQHILTGINVGTGIGNAIQSGTAGGGGNQSARKAVLNAAGVNANELEGGDKGGDRGHYTTDVKSYERFTPEQKNAMKALLEHSIDSIKQLHEEGREPIPWTMKVPWESIAQFGQAGSNLWASTSALAHEYPNVELPALRGQLEALGIPTGSSAYANAMTKAQQDYTNRLWGLRAQAAGQALGALGSLGGHYNRLEDVRQRRFKQLAELSSLGIQPGLQQQAQLLERQIAPPTIEQPTNWQRAGNVVAKYGPGILADTVKWATSKGDNDGGTTPQAFEPQEVPPQTPSSYELTRMKTGM